MKSEEEFIEAKRKLFLNKKLTHYINIRQIPKFFYLSKSIYLKVSKDFLK